MQHGVAPTLTGASVAFTLKDIVARSIADFLEKSPSTILREIQKHSLVKIPNTCTAMTIMDVMLSMYAVPKTVIKNAIHATLPKNTVNIITKEAANTGTVPL